MFHTQTKLFSWISPYLEYFYLFWGHLAGLWLCDVYFKSWPICGPKPGYRQRDSLWYSLHRKCTTFRDYAESIAWDGAGRCTDRTDYREARRQIGQTRPYFSKLAWRPDVWRHFPAACIGQCCESNLTRSPGTPFGRVRSITNFDLPIYPSFRMSRLSTISANSRFSPKIHGVTCHVCFLDFTLYSSVLHATQTFRLLNS